MRPSCPDVTMIYWPSTRETWPSHIVLRLASLCLWNIAYRHAKQLTDRLKWTCKTNVYWLSACSICIYTYNLQHAQVRLRDRMARWFQKQIKLCLFRSKVRVQKWKYCHANGVAIASVSWYEVANLVPFQFLVNIIKTLARYFKRRPTHAPHTMKNFTICIQN